VPIAESNGHESLLALVNGKGVVSIHPEEISVVGAARIGDALELRPGELIQRPTFGALLAGGRGWPTYYSGLANFLGNARDG
jgi:hypothetical protein